MIPIQPSLSSDPTLLHRNVLAASDLTEVPADWIKTALLFVLGIVALVGGVGGIVMMWMNIAEKVKGKTPGRSVAVIDQPLRVSLEQEFVTRREFEKDIKELKDRTHADLRDLKTAIESMGRDVRESIREAFQRLNQHERDLGELDGRYKPKP